jgi:peptide-methionine (R)-S-oxide reductase
MNDRRTFLTAAAAAGTAWLLFGRSSSSAAGLRFEIARTPGQWRHLLGPERYHILREAGTEPPFTSPLLGEHRRGIFVCAACALPLFNAATKFDSGTGWPSFWKPLAGAVVTRTDRSLLMVRSEVLCGRCGGHLGHVFDDGPRPTGLRYCMNGLALRFRPA